MIIEDNCDVEYLGKNGMIMILVKNCLFVFVIRWVFCYSMINMLKNEYVYYDY